MIVLAYLAIFTMAISACVPDAMSQSATPPQTSEAPSPTPTATASPTTTPTLIPSPTASPTLPPSFECFRRYGRDYEPGARGELPPTSDPIISSIFTPEVQFWSSEIQDWSTLYELDPNLIATVMQIESCGHPYLQSDAGAIGLFQVMPFHFQPDEDPTDPETNARSGLTILAYGLAITHGQTDLALAVYNAGFRINLHDSSQWSLETQHYVTWGKGILADVASGNLQSTSMQTWLQAGGNNLCLKACLALARYPTTSTP
jgi:hypothetical protein